MLVNRYYVIYVEVPSGCPGVELIEVEMWLRPKDWKGITNRKEQIRQEFFEVYDRAVLDILEAKR